MQVVWRVPLPGDFSATNLVLVMVRLVQFVCSFVYVVIDAAGMEVEDEEDRAPRALGWAAEVDC